MDLCRHDPRLVKIIRKLKDGANGRYAKLAIKRLKGSQYRIDDYDGNETVIEPGILEHWIVIND